MPLQFTENNSGASRLNFNANPRSRMASIVSLPWDYVTGKPGIVLYDEQSLTADQQAQARQNIGIDLNVVLTLQSAGGTVSVANTTRGYRCTSGVASALTFNLGAAADRADKPFTVALDGANPVSYVITVDFFGAETCRGAGSFVFGSPYQVVTFYPREDGSGFYIG